MGPSAVVVLLLAFQAVSAAPVNENGIPAQTDITSSAVSVGSIVALISGIAIFTVTVFLLIGVTQNAKKKQKRANRCLDCCCWFFENCVEGSEESGGDE